VGVLVLAALDVGEAFAHGHGDLAGLVAVDLELAVVGQDAADGVITAAVPQAMASVMAPEATSSRHSTLEMRFSAVSWPRSRATCSSESRVMPGSREPDSSGVTTVALSPEP